MFLQYPSKKSEAEILSQIPEADLVSKHTSNSKNLLLEGDNLLGLKKLISMGYAGKIDLVYIDPPFATDKTFTVSKSRANTISSVSNGVVAYTDKLKGADFLEFIRERLVLIKLLMSDKGSIYLHTDYKIGHYLKILMDEIFGMDNFRNDISRIKCNPKNFARKAYGNVKDMILFYSKTDKVIWNEPKNPYTEIDKIKLFPKIATNGKRYTTIPLHAPGETQKGSTAQLFKGLLPPEGRHWRTSVETLNSWDEAGLIEWSERGNPRKKIYLEEQEGKRVQDIWELKDPQSPKYPTEKPAALLDLIIGTSSNPESYVLDCFCGSGTTLLAAQKQARTWIGIDQSEIAIKVILEKIKSKTVDIFTQNVDYQHYFLIDSNKE